MLIDRLDNDCLFLSLINLCTHALRNWAFREGKIERQKTNICTNSRAKDSCL